MPIVKTVKGNLLKMFIQDEFHAIAHGCNCFHTMGAGIAGQISRMFAEALEADKQQTKYGDIHKLGRYSIAMTEYGCIINAYTQFQPGREASQRLYRYVGESFSRLSEDLKLVMPIKEDVIIGIPKIGAGIAGGDWLVLKGIIDGVSDGLSIIVVDYDGS